MFRAVVFKSVAALVLFFCGAFLSFSANAQSDASADELSTIPEVHLTYYDVSGAGEQAIRNAMDKSPSRPRNGDRAVDALTTWNFNLSTWKDDHGGCDPSQVEVTFRAEVILPRLVGSVPPDVARDWARYIANLRRHEAGHVTYAKSRFADVLAAARSPRCEDINPAVNHVLDAIREHDRLYDAETSHGLKQGAVFP